MSSALEAYAKRFTQLRPNTNRKQWTAATFFRAPHKPLLLLSVIQLIEEGLVQTNLVELSPDLCETFARYWCCVLPPPHPRGNLSLPFFHLGSSGFWQLLPQPGKEAALEATRQVDSIRRLTELTLGARLDDELFVLLRVPESRHALRAVLIEEYFDPTLRPQLYQQIAVDAKAVEYSRSLLTDENAAVVQEVLTAKDEYHRAARDQGFRRAVVTAYARRCALCGIRILTATGHTAVDAAHIDPWRESRNDSPTNGIALCRLCHWAFDEGMLSVSVHHRILISPQLSGNGNIPANLGTLVDRPILLPAEERYWPDPESLKKHREKIYQTR